MIFFPVHLTGLRIAPSIFERLNGYPSGHLVSGHDWAVQPPPSRLSTLNALLHVLNLQHFKIHQENIQFFALQLSSKARSVYNELRSLDDRADTVNKERVSTSVLSGVTDVLASVKTMVSWLHR